MIGIEVKGKGPDEILNGIAFLDQNRVYVGIPSESAGRGGAISNAELAFIHSNGSPRLRIPARPFIEPAIADGGAQGRIADCLMQAVISAVEGDTGEAMNQLHMAGMAGENAAKAYIGSGNHAPNAPITVHGGWMRNRISGKPFKVKGKGSTVPLIDTGSLRSSITHVVEGK